MLYLIGLGLNEKGISIEGLEVLKKYKKIYLENYTVDFPYKIEELEKIIRKKVVLLERSKVESEDLIKEAKKQDIVLLVYGCPLFATTHISLISDCIESKVKYKIIYSASVFDAIAETGLQLYKFGKIASMPCWTKNHEPYSFLESVQENQSIGAHSLILIDIGLDFKRALEQLLKSVKKPEIKIELDKIIVCSNMGTSNSKILYGDVNSFEDIKINLPFCFIIPGKMHFLEEEIVKLFGV